MPRAVIIAVGDLSLHPIKSLVEEHSISCDIVTATDAETLKSIDTFGSDERNEGKQADCIFVHTQGEVFKHSKGFSDAETLLVYSTPEFYIAQQLADAGDLPNSEQLFQLWASNLNAAMEVSENNDGIKLCSLDDILANPSAFLKAINVDVHSGATNPFTQSTIQKALLLQASAELVDKDDLYELYDDALSLGTLFGEFSVHLSPDADTLKASKNTLKALTNELRDTLSEVSKLKNHLSENTAVIAKKDQQYQDAKVELAALSEKFASVESSLKESSEKLTETVNRKTQMEQRAAALEKERDTYKEKIASLETDTGKLQESLKVARERAEELVPTQERLKATEEKAFNLDKQVVQLKEDLTAKSKKNDEAKAEVESLTKKLATVEGSLKDFSDKLTEATNSKAHAEQRAAAVEKERDTYKEKIASLETDTGKLQESLKVARERGEQLAPTQERLKATEEKASSLDKQVVQLKEDLTAKSKKNDEANAEVESLTKKLATVEGSLKDSSNKLAEATNSKAHAEQRAAAVEKERDTYKEKIASLETDTGKLQESLKVARERGEQLVPTQERLKATEEKASNLDKQVVQLKEELTAKSKKNDEANAEVESLTNKLVSVEDRLKNSSNKLAEATNSKAHAEQRVVALEKERDSCKEKISFLESNLKVKSEKSKLTKLKLAQLEAEIKLTTNKLTKIPKLNDSLIVAEKTITELNRKVAISNESSRLIKSENEQLKSELERSLDKLQKLEKAEFRLTDAEKLKNHLQVQLESSKVSKKIANMQMLQLQEEIRLHLVKEKNEEASQNNLRNYQEKVSELAEELSGKRKEINLLKNKIKSLQQEIEGTALSKSSKETASDELVEKFKSKYASLETSLKDKSNSNELSKLQVVQLQKELEATFLLLEEFRGKNRQLLKQLDLLKVEKQSINDENVILNSEAQIMRGEESKSAEANAKTLKNVNTELELAALQISQLQQELEFYFIAMQNNEDLFSKELGYNAMNGNAVKYRAFDKVRATKLSVTGQYITDGYQDIHLNLSDVSFPSGEKFDSIEVKLISVGEQIGIEFRKQGIEGLFSEYDDATDEYGPYLRYLITPSAQVLEDQRKILERLNTRERLLIMGCINAISQLLQHPNIELNGVELSSQHLREWRKAAVALAKHVESLPNWLSFDEVSLREEYTSEGYEHLWLVFRNVLCGSEFRNIFEFKLSASGIGESSGNQFSDILNMEFRELDDGTPPLTTWPPEEFDEYGPKLSVGLNDIASLDGFAEQDSHLLQLFVDNLPSILEKLNTSKDLMKRNKADWISAVKALQERSVSSDAESDSYQLNEDQESAISINLRNQEVVSDGSYHHIVFDEDGSNLKIKIRAENVNPDTFDAEVYLELRNGTNDIIYSDSEFYTEDEYGPNVKLPAELLLNSDSAHMGANFEWALMVFQQIEESIQSSENIDELVKLLWKNILSRKAKK